MSDIQKQIVDANVSSVEGRSLGGGKLDNRGASSAILKALSEGKKPTTANEWIQLGYKPQGRDGFDEVELGMLNKAMKISEGLNEKMKQGKTAIRAETKQKTWSLRSLIRGQKEVTSATALASIQEGNQFRYINDQIARAIIKDFEGPLIEGGLLGGLYKIIKPGTNLEKAISNIEDKFGKSVAENVKNNVLPKLSKQLEIAQMIVKQDESYANKIGTFIGSPFGARTRDFIINQWATNSDFRKYAANNVKKGLMQVGLSALGAITTGTVFGGMIKIPGITIQRKGTFTQDTLAREYSGGTKDAHDYLQEPLNQAAVFINRENKKEKGIDTGGAKKISIQLASGLVINVDGLIDKLNQSENRLRNAIDKIPIIGWITDDERGLKNKIVAYGELMKQDRLLDPQERERAYGLHQDISEKLETWTIRESKRTGKSAFNAAVSLQALSDTGEATRLTASAESLSRGARFETFLNANRHDLEKMVPNKQEYQTSYDAIMAYKKGGSFSGKSGPELAKHIWESNDIPGAQAMFKAYTYGGERAVASYEKIYRNGASQKMINTVGDKYGEKLPDDVLRNPTAVSDYLATHENNGINLAARYANTLDRIGRNNSVDFQILSTDVVEYAKNGVYQSNFVGQNTGMSTSQIKEGKMQTQPCLVFKVPATIDGMRGWLEIGVKGDCANLVIGEFSQTRNVNNSEALISLRAPLLYSIKKGGDTPTRKGSKGGKETPPRETTTSNPNGPRASSKPGSEAGNVPDKGGYGSNAGDGSFTGDFRPSGNTPPSSPGAVGAGGLKPKPSGPKVDPFPVKKITSGQ